MLDQMKIKSKAYPYI